MLFQWNDTYSVANEKIDNQHKKMFLLGNSILTVTKKEEAQVIFQELSEYTLTHFKDEETMMRELGYPHLEEHIEKHNQLREQLLKIKEQSNFSAPKDIYALADYVMRLIRNHIIDMDKEYASFVQKQQSKSL